MTSLEMLREFKVGLDKIDSQTYPEIYDEQIFMFINRFIIGLVNEGRKVFEETQQITDNLKSLVPKEPLELDAVVSTIDPRIYNFDVSTIDYFFHISSYAKTSVEDLSGEAETKITQHNDIRVILKDPFNKPKPYKVPISFVRDTISAYSDGLFKIDKLYLRYMKKPAIVSATINCDLDEQLHYSIVEGAIGLASQTLGITPQELNK